MLLCSVVPSSNGSTLGVAAQGDLLDVTDAPDGCGPGSRPERNKFDQARDKKLGLKMQPGCDLEEQFRDHFGLEFGSDWD